MDLSNLHPPIGSRKNRKRKGRGESSGLGKTAGKGNKGQLARSGHNHKVGFEGGQMPLVRRLPKFGFTNVLRVKTRTISLAQLNQFEDGSEITVAVLKEKKLIPSKFQGRVKILATGTLEKKLNIAIGNVSESARKAILDKGGNIQS